MTNMIKRMMSCMFTCTFLLMCVLIYTRVKWDMIGFGLVVATGMCGGLVMWLKVERYNEKRLWARRDR